MAQGVNRVIDQRAAVIEWHYPHTLRQAGLHVGEFLLDRLDDFERISTVADDDDATDGLLATVVQHPPTELRTELYGCNIAHVDGRSVRSGQDDVLDVIHSANQANAAHHVFGVIDLHHLRADVVVAAFDGVEDFTHWDVVGAQLHRIDIDLILADEAADAGDLRHTRYGVELILDEPVLNGVQSAAVVGTFDGIPEHLPHTGCVRPKHRSDSCGKKAAGCTQPFEYPSAGEVDVNVVVEDDVDHREPERRRRTDRLHTGQSLQIDGERVGDLVLHLLRAAAWPIAEHNDLVFTQVWDRIDRRVHHRPITGCGQGNVSGHDEEAITKGEFNDSVNHVGSSMCRQTNVFGSHDMSVASGFNGRIPRPSRRHVDCSAVLFAIPGEIGGCAHLGHAHGRHGRNHQGDLHLCIKDRLARVHQLRVELRWSSSLQRIRIGAIGNLRGLDTCCLRFG